MSHQAVPRPTPHHQLLHLTQCRGGRSGNMEGGSTTGDGVKVHQVPGIGAGAGAANVSQVPLRVSDRIDISVWVVVLKVQPYLMKRNKGRDLEGRKCAGGLD